MNGFIVGAALGAALVGAGEHDWSQLIAHPQSEATTVLEKQCGLYASSARGSKDPLAYDFGSLAVVSAMMNDNSNIKLSDKITRLLGSDLDKFNREEPAIGNLIWDIAARSAKCGAAFGLVASGR
jgi:hypothetical protein